MNLASILVLTLLLLALPQTAHAYLDPGTGSMLLSVCIGLLSAGYFMVRKIPEIVRSAIFKATGKADFLKRRHIVIYGESANYWGTFKPLLEEFGRRGEPVEYLTSSENDPCFTASLPECITCRYIGTGNKAYTALNFIKADVMVLTTPGVDVLQIRRSKGAGKYIHVVHSLTDIHYYKLFSFDYYDAVICNGNYQVQSIRNLEKERGTRPKELPIAGCPYLDGLKKRLDMQNHAEPDKNCILVAPTWGKLSMFTKYGSTVPKILAEAGFKIILRPHPQSYISDLKLMEQIEADLAGYDNITWDKNPDGFESLQKASVMISDISGIILDFAFLFLRPVIALYDENQNPDGFEAFDLTHLRWDMAILKEIGPAFNDKDMKYLPELVKRTALENSWQKNIAKIRNENIANFGNAAKPVCDAILALSGDVNPLSVQEVK